MGTFAGSRESPAEGAASWQAGSARSVAQRSRTSPGTEESRRRPGARRFLCLGPASVLFKARVRTAEAFLRAAVVAAGRLLPLDGPAAAGDFRSGGSVMFRPPWIMAMETAAGAESGGARAGSDRERHPDDQHQQPVCVSGLRGVVCTCRPPVLNHGRGHLLWIRVVRFPHSPVPSPPTGETSELPVS